MTAIRHLVWFACLFTAGAACSPEPASPATSPPQSQQDLIEISPTGEIQTPQVRVDAGGRATVAGLGAMQFDSNGDIYGSDGTKLFDGVTNRWSAGLTNQAAVVAALNTFTKGFNYSGREFRRETVARVSFDAPQHLLGITLDDAEETDPITALIPLGEVTLLQETFSQGSRITEGILLTCRNASPNCITVTRDAFHEVMAAGRAGPGAQLKGATRRNIFGFGCRPERCVAIFQALGRLAQ